MSEGSEKLGEEPVRYTVKDARITKVSVVGTLEDGERPILTFHGGLPLHGIRELVQVLQGTYGEIMYLRQTPEEWNCPGNITVTSRGERIPRTAVEDIAAALSVLTVAVHNYMEDKGMTPVDFTDGEQ